MLVAYLESAGRLGQRDIQTERYRAFVSTYNSTYFLLVCVNFNEDRIAMLPRVYMVIEHALILTTPGIHSLRLSPSLLFSSLLFSTLLFFPR